MCKRGNAASPWPSRRGCALLAIVDPCRHRGIWKSYFHSRESVSTRYNHELAIHKLLAILDLWMEVPFGSGRGFDPGEPPLDYFAQLFTRIRSSLAESFLQTNPGSSSRPLKQVFLLFHADTEAD